MSDSQDERKEKKAMESLIEQILTLVSGSPEFGALVQMMYFFTLFAELLGMPIF